MSAENPDRGESAERGQWQGYADYQHVSISTARAIDQAINHYARIRGLHAQHARIKPEVAAKAHGKMLAPCMQLLPEMQHERDADGGDAFEEILNDWTGEEGHLNKLSDLYLVESCPGWLQTMMVQLRQAGWELGYLKAGKRDAPDPDDPVEAEAKSMFAE